MKNQDENINSIIGEKILNKRRALKISQDVLAKMIGVTRVQIVNIEQGRSGTGILNILRLSKALLCEINELVPSESEYPIELFSVEEKSFLPKSELIKRLNAIESELATMKKVNTIIE